jgi:hypothetical protein
MPKKLTTEQFIEKATSVHSGRYSYEHTKYNGTAAKVTIGCSVHGQFKQTANDHLCGYGCPTCGGSVRVTTEGFIKRAQQTHGSEYSYHKTKLQGMNKKATITCGVHGDFSQRAADHIDGAGCPACGTLKQGRYTFEYFENNPDIKTLPAKLYLLLFDNKFCKIGITKRLVKSRFSKQKASVVVSKTIPLFEAFTKEQELLNKYKSERYKTQFLRGTGYSGWTECFPKRLLPTLKNEMEQM